LLSGSFAQPQMGRPYGSLVWKVSRNNFVGSPQMQKRTG